MTDWHLAQLNIAQLRVPLDHPDMADFTNNLERINGLAEASPGFVWRLKDEDGVGATALRPFGEDVLVNLSVWQDIDSLKRFVYDSDHTPFLRRRGDWFDRMQGPAMVLWWVKAGHMPDEAEAGARLKLLAEAGPSADAFTFGKIWPAPEGEI